MQELLPTLSQREFQGLKHSIERFGVKNPIYVLPDGRIIDGHHRWKIAGKKAPVQVLDITEADAIELGKDLNIERRQLSNEQISEIEKRWEGKDYLTIRKLAEPLKRLGEMISKKREESIIEGLQEKPQSIVAAEHGVSRRRLREIAAEIKERRGPANILPDHRVSIPKAEHKKIFERVERGEAQKEVAADYKVSSMRISQIVKVEEERRKPVPVSPGPPAIPDEVYQCIVIDPPWPMKKIEREEAPTQGPNLDYPTMEIEEIKALPIPKMMNKMGCHVYLWTTHKFLPTAFEIFEHWGVRYECLLTWVKPGGFCPFSWMYNTEHILFGRGGKGLELQRKGLKVGFTAPTTGHSVKPEDFYRMVIEASPEPRLEMFARKPHDGFEPWGDAVER